MYSSIIALGIRYFNITLTVVLAIFAIYGVIVIFGRNTRLNPFRGKMFWSAFCVASLLAFALETTVFNFPYYLRYFAGPTTEIVGRSETDSSILLTTDGTHAELIKNGIRFNNLNRKVTSIFVNLNFGNAEVMEMLVEWADEGSTYQYTKLLYKYLPHENYALLQPFGKVSELSIMFGGKEIAFNDVVVNKPVPLYFSGLRLLVVSLLFFAIILFAYKPLRAKMSYYLFEYAFDPKNKKQNIVYACTVCLLILFSWVCVYTSDLDRLTTNPQYLQYNKYLVDAIIDGRTYLDYGHPEKLLTVERPYDYRSRNASGYRLWSDDVPADWSWYKGKFYCYYGVVPAVFLFVPYKLITGNYLSNHAGVSLFGAVSVVLLALLWRYCVQKYMRDIRFTLYLLSFLTLFFASGICGNLRFPLFYSIVIIAGFMFTIAGVLLLLKSVDKERINLRILFSACLCFALVFGCRPNLGLASLLVPVVLWKHRSWKLLLFIMIPYILVAIPLCCYNYVRFESIFDFGVNYCLNIDSMPFYSKQNPLGKIFRTFVAFAYYLFCPNQFMLNFPFVKGLPSEMELFNMGTLWVCLQTNAVINYPVVFCLLYLFKNIFNKNKPKTFYLLCASLFIGTAITLLCSFVLGTNTRYMLDIATFFILPSLFCAYYFCQRNIVIKDRLIITYALIAVSVLVGLFMFVQTEWGFYDPAVYRYLEHSFSFFGDV